MTILHTNDHSRKVESKVEMGTHRYTNESTRYQYGQEIYKVVPIDNVESFSSSC